MIDADQRIFRLRRDVANTGLAQRAKEAQQAHEEVHAAFVEVIDRNDHSDPRTKRWLVAIDRFRDLMSRVFPAALQQVDIGTLKVGELQVEDILDFLETDPLFFRSGYMKQRLLREIKKRRLDPLQTLRLQNVVLYIAGTKDCREYRYYCHVAATVDDAHLRSELEKLRNSDDTGAKRRADWMLKTMEHVKRSKSG